MPAVVTDKWPEVTAKILTAADTAMGAMAADIERLGKLSAPVDTGELYASGKHYRIMPLHWRVSFGEDSPSGAYAEYQEAGQRRDGSYVVRNYTKPGTGSHFLEISANNVALQAPGAFRTAQAAIGSGIL